MFYVCYVVCCCCSSGVFIELNLYYVFLKDCFKFQLNLKSHFERMHDSDNFKSERFLQDMCYIQDQVAQGDRFR